MFNLIKIFSIILFLAGCASLRESCYERIGEKNFPSEVSIARDLLFETANLEVAIEGLKVNVGCGLSSNENGWVPIYYGFINGNLFVAFSKIVARAVRGEEVEGVSVVLYSYKKDGSVIGFGEISSYFRFEGYGVMVDAIFDGEGIQLCQREVEHYSYFENGDIDRELEVPVFYDCEKKRINF